MDEMFDIVDEFDRVIAQAPRSEVHRVWHKHRAVHIFAFDDRGRLWLQRRSANKGCSPLRWDSSAAGHLGAGESYDVCAIREVREEIGLRVVPRFRFKLGACPETGWEHVSVYTCRINARIRFNTDEIIEGAYFASPSIAAWIDRAPDQFASGFVRIYREFQHRGWFKHCL
jgi:16S rRNA (adenine1518-N6/adenine1519-N6)-dimethyltransferase